jgi:hypothetical protein
MRNSTGLWVLTAAVALLGTASQLHADPQHIGYAHSVSDVVEGVLPGQQDILKPGSKVFHDETVRTNTKSLAQLQFLDNSSLSVAPSSEVKLDTFVYDPNQHTGQVVLNATRGAFRFIAGSQDAKSYTIKTPAATIGIRGTIVNVIYDGSTLTAQLEEGSAFITTPDGHTYDITTPGWGVVVTNGTTTGPQKINAPVKDPFQVGWGKFYLTTLKQQLDDGKASGLQADGFAKIVDDAVLAYGIDYVTDISGMVTQELKLDGYSDGFIGQVLDIASAGIPGGIVTGATNPPDVLTGGTGTTNTGTNNLGTSTMTLPPCANPSCS